MIGKVVSLVLQGFVCLAMLVCATATLADTLDDIKARGRLVVGVKKDVKLWGYADPATGKLEGLEPDLAADLAKSLGVTLELVGLLTSERIDALESRRVDVLIATLSDTPERQARLNMVEPHYYSAGANVIARKSQRFLHWTDLRNRRVCGRRGAFYNRLITLAYGADIVALYSNELSKVALRDGRCAAYLYDDTVIVAMLKEPLWQVDFEMPLTSLYPTPWSVALNRADKGSKLEAAVSNVIVGWHRTGALKRAEAQWGIPPTEFVKSMNERWSLPAGAVGFCGDSVTATTPKACR